MVNIKKVVSVMAISSVLGLSGEIVNSLNGTANVANAATAWHKGAPKAMIGNWKYNLHSDAQGGNTGIMTSWKNRTIKDVQGEHGEYIKTKRYKSLGNGKYAIKVSGYAGGDIYNETIKIKVYKGDQKIKFLSDGESNVTWHKTSHANYKYSDWSFKN